MRVFCDFDGTISDRDTTDLVLSRLADPSWEAIEADWIAGSINAATCMTRQIALLPPSLGSIDAVLDEVTLRDGFPEFLHWAERHGVPVTIVSDGVDYFIRRVLANNLLTDLPIIANRLVPRARGWTLEQPFRRSGCAAGSGVCKCAVVDAFRDDRPIAFVGDGRSDFCVAARPDILFATGSLIDHCTARGIGHHRFTRFADVQAVLQPLVAPAPILA